MRVFDLSHGSKPAAGRWIDSMLPRCYGRFMKSRPITGVVHGDSIVLDSPIPPLDGRRVRVTVEPIENPDLVLSPEESARFWQEWVERGPRGPIEGGGDWPDEV